MSAAADRLRQFLREQVGVSLGPEKDYLIDSRLRDLLRRWQLGDLSALAERLAQQPVGALASAVTSALTTHETSWFRDRRPFERLRDEVLPLLRQHPLRPLSLWSAACSTGQEAYSLAMLLREQGLHPPQWQVSLLASDICEPALAQAALGVYSAFELGRGLPDGYLGRYFQPAGADWQVLPALRAAIRFEALNLIRLPPGLGRFNVIFCRNVLIYFEPALQQSVLRQLQDRLQPGGFLFLGAAESPLGLGNALQPWGGHSGLYRLPP